MPKQPTRGGDTPDKQTGGMFHGLLGEAVRALEPSTEADPNGMLVVLLSMFGNAIGTHPHFIVSHTRHGARINVLVVGKTGAGRKGTAQSAVDALMCAADPDWFNNAKTSGISTGEGIITAAKNATTAEKTASRYRIPVASVMLVESEFARTLIAIDRSGNNASQIIRDAWDNTHLSTKTKEPVEADGHISIVGHITPSELQEKVNIADLSSGFINRFLIAKVHAERIIPDPADLTEVINDYGERIGNAIKFARDAGQIKRAPEASDRWAELYTEWAKDSGDLSARAAPYVMRLAMIYALADLSTEIRVCHLEAANAVWQYNLRSIKRLFYGVSGHHETLLRALINAPNHVMTARQVSALFSNGLNKYQLDPIKDELIEWGYMVKETEDRKGPGKRPHIFKWTGDKPPSWDEAAL